MPGNRAKQETHQIINLKSTISSEKNLLTGKQNPLLRTLSRLFKISKIDHKALRETLEITFWK